MTLWLTRLRYGIRFIVHNIKRIKLANICDKIPEAAAMLTIKSTPGRPRLEMDQPDLLQSIINIATVGGGADDRRRS